MPSLFFTDSNILSLSSAVVNLGKTDPSFSSPPLGTFRATQRFLRLELPGKTAEMRPDFGCFSSAFYNKHFHFVESDGNNADILAKMSLS